MVTPEGKVVGQHHGSLMYYTLGQRGGLGIGGPGEPWFVAGKQRDANQLLVVQGHDHPLLYSPALCADQLSWTLGATEIATSARPLRRQKPLPHARRRLHAGLR